MKSITKRIPKVLLLLTAVCALCVLCTLTACTGRGGPPYQSLDEQGYTVSVRFDANGGVFAGTNDVTVVDVFNPENESVNANGETEFRLLSPDDPLRKERAFSISRTGYFLAGWYTERTLRTDENGAPADEYGVPTAESGRPQGYTYAGRWDFATDVAAKKIDGTESSETPILTLYAAWIPYFDYEFYTETGDPLGSLSLIDLETPAWDESTGKLNLKRFPDRDGMTLDGAFLDAACTLPMTDALRGTAYVDYETGTTKTESVSIYTKWLTGDWFRIYTPKQLLQNAKLGGHYVLCADLDFSDAVWPPLFATGKFTGSIIGNGHKISNVSVTQADASKTAGGLFGQIDASATLTDVCFENISYTVKAGSRMQGASFGLLAGSVADGATLEGITLTGILYISESCYPQSDYRIGLVTGIGSVNGIDDSGITCRPLEEGTERISVELGENGAVILTFKE